jgi:hypothetical protein
VSYKIGYCTNVHAGATLEITRANLERHALAVKERYSPQEPMGVGLWLSARAAEELLSSRREGEFGEWLAVRGLVPYTLNGFPYGDFHQDVVKHRVYEPTWWQPERLHYTMQLAQIVDALLPPGQEGSISTLPIAWGKPCPDRSELEQAAVNLRQAAAWMHQLEAETGRLVYLCLEAEPGCVFSFSDDVVHYFQWQLLGHEDEEIVRRHIRLCHDICHATVMFEDQAEVLAKYQEAGIGVGKIQVSAALAMDLDLFEPPATEARRAAIKQMSQFAEDRYLHQTVIRRGSEDIFYDDLPAALAEEARDPQGEWRVHYHVPIYLREFGRLRSTQDEILRCLAAARQYTSCRHYEVETYAWGVLPAELKQPELAAGIAEELKWFEAATAVDSDDE